MLYKCYKNVTSNHSSCMWERTQVQFLAHVSDFYLLCCFIFFGVGGRELEKG